MSAIADWPRAISKCWTFDDFGKVREWACVKMWTVVDLFPFQPVYCAICPTSSEILSQEFITASFSGFISHDTVIKWMDSVSCLLLLLLSKDPTGNRSWTAIHSGAQNLWKAKVFISLPDGAALNNTFDSIPPTTNWFSTRRHIGNV